MERRHRRQPEATRPGMSESWCLSCDGAILAIPFAQMVLRLLIDGLA